MSKRHYRIPGAGENGAARRESIPAPRRSGCAEKIGEAQMIRRLLRDVLVLFALFLSLAVVPANLDRALEHYFPRVVDCERPLQVGEYQTRAVAADGRIKLRCKRSMMAGVGK